MTFQNQDGNWEIPASPKTSIHERSIHDRIFGRRFHVPVTKNPDGVQSLEDLAGDIFHSLFKVNPKMLENPMTERHANSKIIEWVQSSGQWSDLKAETQGRAVAAADAAGLMWHYLISDDAFKEALKEQAEMEQAKNEAQDAAQALENNQQGYGKPFSQNEMNQLQDKIQKAQQKAQQAEARMEAQLGKLEKSAFGKATIGNAVQKSKEKAEETNEMMEAMGWGDGTELGGEMSFSDLLKLVKNMDEFVKQVAKAAGRAKKAALKAGEFSGQSTVHAATEANYTKDLMKVFPQERIKLSNHAPRALKALTVSRWVQHGLQGWIPRTDKKEEGCFVAAVDVSGSMGGQRIRLARGTALGVALAAKEKGRKWAAFNFNGSITRRADYQSDTHEFMAWASENASGGTSFNNAFRQLMKEIKAMIDRGIKGVDALFLTDEECYLSDEVRKEWIEFREMYGVKLLYVSIAGYRGGGDISDLADKVMNIQELDIAQADKIAGELGSWVATS